MEHKVPECRDDIMLWEQVRVGGVEIIGLWTSCDDPGGGRKYARSTMLTVYKQQNTQWGDGGWGSQQHNRGGSPEQAELLSFAV